MDFSVNGVNGATAGAGLDWLGAAVSVGDSIATNLTNKGIAQQNIDFARETNAMNRELTEKAWERDDTAVQRRVKDLKASGLSPLLAAGSAAGNSSPIALNAPHNDYRRQNTFSEALPAIAAVESIKGQKLDNDLKALNAMYFGMPDWLIGITRILNETPEDNPLHRAINKVFSLLDIDLSSFNGWDSPSPSTRPIPEHINNTNSWADIVRGSRPWLPSLDSSGPNSPQATMVISEPSSNYSLQVDPDRYNKLVSDMKGKGQGQLNNLRQRVFRWYSKEGYTEREIEFIWESALKDSGH